MPLGCIYAIFIVSKPLVYLYANGNFGRDRIVAIHIVWGFSLVACFDKQGNSQEPQRWSK